MPYPNNLSFWDNRLCLKSYINFPHGIYLCFLGRSKDAKKKRRREVPKSPEKREQDHHQNECHIISSGDDDCLNGIKSMNCVFKIITLYLLKKYKCNPHIG
jgi:hypothetical protein